MEIDFGQVTQGGVIAVVAGAVTYFYPKIMEYLRTKWAANLEELKQLEANKKSNTEQALAMYTSLIDGLKADIDELMGKLDNLHKEHTSCREENSALRAEVRSLTARIEHLEKRT